MSNKHLIYLHRNKVNNKVYIGRTVHTENPNIRWQNGYGYSRQEYFFKDIEEFGWNNFEHIILETDLTDDVVDIRENYWINYYESNNPEKGYNLTASGCVSDSTREKMSKAWALDPERKEKQRQLITELNKTIDRTGVNNSMYGKTRTGKNAGRKRKVQCLETGEIFETMADAAKWFNPNGGKQSSHMREQILGHRNYCGRHPISNIPLHWKYIDEIEKEKV